VYVHTQKEAAGLALTCYAFMKNTSQVSVAQMHNSDSTRRYHHKMSQSVASCNKLNTCCEYTVDK